MFCNCFVVLIFSIGTEVLPATEVFLGIEPSRNVVLTYYTRLTFQYYSWNLLQLSKYLVYTQKKSRFILHISSSLYTSNVVEQ